MCLSRPVPTAEPLERAAAGPVNVLERRQIRHECRLMNRVSLGHRRAHDVRCQQAERGHTNSLREEMCPRVFPRVWPGLAHSPPEVTNDFVLAARLKIACGIQHAPLE